MGLPDRIRCLAAAMMSVLAVNAASASAFTVTGVVKDSVNGDPLPFATVELLSGRSGALTNDDGRFVVSGATEGDSLRLRLVGYRSKTIPLSGNLGKLSLVMTPEDQQLGEVVVTRRGKYRKKGNPAVELMERLRRAAPMTDPRRDVNYRHDRYEKKVLGINDVDFSDEKKGIRKRLDFITDFVDTLGSGKQVLLLSVKEKMATVNYRKGGAEVVTVDSRSSGIDESFNQENINTFLNDVFREVNLYDHDIPLMQNRFVSPLSPLAANYYMFFLGDTVTDGKNKSVELIFAPHNPESFGFNGTMLVAIDDTVPRLRKLNMRVPKRANLNYVEFLGIDQEYITDSLGYVHKTLDDMTVEFRVFPGTPGFYVKRQINDSGFAMEESMGVMDIFSLNDMRPVPLSYAEQAVGNMLSRLRKYPAFLWTERVLKILVNGYISTGKKSRFDIGPVNTMLSFNSIEGTRLRFGGMTTANLSPHWFARGYVAHGFKDHRWKYGAELEYSIVKKRYHSREYPMNSVRAEHSYDLDMIGQHYLFTNSDNIFLSFKRKASDKVTYRRMSRIDYRLELKCGFSLEAGLRHEIQYPGPLLGFVHPDGRRSAHLTEAMMTLGLRYAPGETFYQAASQRLPVNMDAPVINLNFEYGPKGFLGSDFTLCKAELSAMKRLWIPAAGYVDLMAKGGIIWSSVPYTSLLWQNANLSYTIQPESFSLMNPMEFVMDKYVGWDMTYWLNGTLFNRIPGFKRLKLREVLGFKGVWGDLSPKNDPACNGNLYIFPEAAATRVMGRKPYMEVSAGIDNILTILRVDYVWRLTYRDTPGADRSGVRISLHFTF